MSKFPASLQAKANSYAKLSDNEKRVFIETLYHKHQLSYPEIAEAVGTYANKIRRDAKKCGIQSRTIAEAQTIALETGRHEHPTAGKKHSVEAKAKISGKMSDTWKGLTDEEKEYRSQIGKDHWNSLSEAEKEKLQAAAGDAIRKAAKEGSKLEKFLFEALTNEGFIVEFHRERLVTNQRLQVDIFLPKLATAIEVDGPSHFLPIWGQETLERNRRSDNQKAGLVLAAGWCLVRVRQTQSLSQKYKREVAERLLSELHKIKTKFPPRGKRLITIGGEEYE